MTYFESLINKTKKMVKRWHGYPAEMNELTKSHSILRIVVYGEEFGKNLVIVCLEPLFIYGPTKWENSSLEIRSAQQNGEDIIIIEDVENGVKIISGSFEVKENVKL